MYEDLTYGTDIKFNDDFSDIDESLTLTSDASVVLQALVLRLTSDEGSLWYDPDFGYNISNLIGSPINVNSGVILLTTRIENECVKDERVQSAKCTIEEFSLLSSNLKISINIKLKEGKEFDLVFSLLDDNIDIEAKGI